MKRTLSANDKDPVDLLIVGGGIYGAAMAYYASLNNLKVALIEKDDFCSHTSANSQKVIHGGLRYLQSFDIKRVLESIRERQRFYTLFSHIVQPLPCVLPVSGWGMKSREAMGAAFYLYRFLQKCVCRNEFTAHLDKKPRLLSAEEILSMFPYLDVENLRGGALWYDGLCVEPERIVLGLLKRAAKKGAAIANYARLTDIKRDENGIVTVTVHDSLNDETSILKTRKIALCTGPWLKDRFGLDSLPEELQSLALISGVNIVTEPITDSGASIALKPRKPEQGGLMFVLPWKKYSIAGTVWEEGGDSPTRSSASKKTRDQFNAAVQRSYPNSEQRSSSILKCHFGYVPGSRDTTKKPSDRVLSHFRFVDREKEKKGDILQIVGVKFTTVFDVTLKALAELFPAQHFRETIAEADLPVGSSRDSIAKYVELLHVRYGARLSVDTLKTLFGLLGFELSRILDEYVLNNIPENSESIPHYTVLKGLCRFFIEEEMVVSLVDLIQRRLFPDMEGLLAEHDLNIIASEMALLLNWSTAERELEIKNVRKITQLP